MDHPYPWLRYLDAGDLDDDTVDFDGLDVESSEREHVGDEHPNNSQREQERVIAGDTFRVGHQAVTGCRLPVAGSPRPLSGDVLGAVPHPAKNVSLK